MSSRQCRRHFLISLLLSYNMWAAGTTRSFTITPSFGKFLLDSYKSYSTMRTNYVVSMKLGDHPNNITDPFVSQIAYMSMCEPYVLPHNHPLRDMYFADHAVIDRFLMAIPDGACLWVASNSDFRLVAKKLKWIKHRFTLVVSFGDQSNPDATSKLVAGKLIHVISLLFK
jgi:hypothetical protein